MTFQDPEDLHTKCEPMIPRETEEDWKEVLSETWVPSG